jgi:hypothetical protein
MSEKNARGLVKEFGLARLVGMADGLSKTQLAGLAKVADDYGKSEFAKQFNELLRLRKLSTRKTRET